MARMVDISIKPEVPRTATASGFIRLKEGTIRKIRAGEVPKGDVLTVAQTAAILAVKRTPEFIPLAHPIPITSTEVNFELEEGGVRVNVEVKSMGKTGVEMEALVGVAGALLAIWDMVKGMEKDEAGQYPTTEIAGVKVVRKSKEWVE
ncbi:MAG: cyclic pyranopterin monophosphate synthase MoaC [Candidatus Hodarchaeaceae archaeon]|nr:cyclic pyranopterin monophosphate synthase MoaC [Candidatus Hodarchaeaceae archaeon]